MYDYHIHFITATILNWESVLIDKLHKEIILDSLKFLVEKERVRVYAFVIMNNHIHILWRIMDGHKREDVQRDFLKFTAHKILRSLKDSNHPLLSKLKVDAKDREYQVWERNSLSIEIWNEEIFYQKLNYIHQNPVKANLCNLPEDYEFSSAKYYSSGINNYEFVSHYKG
jgi:putative transposase